MGVGMSPSVRFMWKCTNDNNSRSTKMLLHFMDIRWYCTLTHTCTDIHCTCSSWICIFDNQNILYILLQVKPFIIVGFMIKGLLYWINMIKILKKKIMHLHFVKDFSSVLHNKDWLNQKQSGIEDACTNDLILFVTNIRFT